MTPRLVLVPLSCLLAMALASCGAKPTITCATPQLHRADGTLYDTRVDYLDIQQHFATGVTETLAGEAIKGVRARYPEASNNEIFNYLVAAYCPVDVSTTSGKDAQQKKLDDFERTLRGLLKL